VRAELVPAIDPAPLPGPPWLFQVLWTITLLVHFLFMNAALGGSILAVLAGRGAGSRETRGVLLEVISWSVSLAVTFGIAPLLFVQVLFGRFFYSATVLVAWAWLGMLGFLMVGYYLNWIAKFRLRAGRDPSLLLGAEALCFLAVAAVQVAVNLLHLQPERWEHVADSAWAALADPSFAARWLHFVLAAVTVAGALLAWIATRRPGPVAPAPGRRAMARFGIRAALVAASLQLVDGFWLLFALPRDVLDRFLGAGLLTLVPLALGVLGGAWLVAALARLTDPTAAPQRVRFVALLLAAATLLMVVTRHQVRDAYLAPARLGEPLLVTAQWGPLALFAACFALCVGLTVWIVARAVRDRPAAGEPVA
jgi:hypothetical protein